MKMLQNVFRTFCEKLRNDGWNLDESKFVIWTDFGYGTVEDEKVVTQLNKKKYIKVKKQKKPEEIKDPSKHNQDDILCTKIISPSVPNFSWM